MEFANISTAIHRYTYMYLPICKEKKALHIVVTCVHIYLGKNLSVTACIHVNAGVFFCDIFSM